MDAGQLRLPPGTKIFSVAPYLAELLADTWATYYFTDEGGAFVYILNDMGDLTLALYTGAPADRGVLPLRLIIPSNFITQLQT